MSRMRVMAAAALAALFAVSTAWGQQQTQRVAGTIDKVEGKTLYIKSASGPVTLTLADNAVIVARVKATAADIRAGDYVASAFRSPTALRRQWSCASSPTACAAMATDIGRGGRAPPTAP
jgi:hypothetical protein